MSRSSDMFSEPIVVPPVEERNHSHTIIFLHGRSGTGEKMSAQLFNEELSSGLSLHQRFPTFRWVFPTSKSRFNDVFQEDMHEWFSIASLTDPGLHENEQIPGISESVQYIYQIIQHEMISIPADKIFLAGVSMGCATALMAWLCSDLKLAGFLGLFGWMPFEKDARKQDENDDDPMTATAKKLREKLGVPVPPGTTKLGTTASETPCFVGHSRDDDVVDVALGRSMCDVLGGMGIKVT